MQVKSWGSKLNCDRLVAGRREHSLGRQQSIVVGMKPKHTVLVNSPNRLGNEVEIKTVQVGGQEKSGDFQGHGVMLALNVIGHQVKSITV